MTKLYFYYSSMNAGKSASLILNNFNYNNRGMNTVSYIPSIINDSCIKSRTGLRTDAISFDKDFDIHRNIFYQHRNIKAIFIDEAQFLTKEQVLQLCKIVDMIDVQVYCYGIRSDYKGEPFEGSSYLMTLADVITEIKTVCDCGKKAIMNRRLTEKTSQIEIGGNKYKSMCRKCFHSL